MVEEKGLMPEQIYDADETGDLFTAKNSCFQSQKICSRIEESKGILFPLLALLSH